MATDAKLLLATAYASAAQEYAHLWSPVIQPMGARLIAAMPLGKANRVLDVGTGSGGLLSVIRARAPAALIVGIDRVDRMLRLARSESPGTPLAVMDTEELAFRTATFDAALLAFILFNLPDPVRGLSETARVLRRPGCVGTATWGVNQALPAPEIWDQELDAAGARPEALPPEVQQHGLMDAPDKVGQLMEGAGLEPVRLWAERFERRWAWEELYRLRSGFGLYRRRLGTLSEDPRRACLGRIRARMSSLSSAALVWRPEVVLALGRHPSK